MKSRAFLLRRRACFPSPSERRATTHVPTNLHRSVLIPKAACHCTSLHQFIYLSFHNCSWVFLLKSRISFPVTMQMKAFLNSPSRLKFSSCSMPTFFDLLISLPHMPLPLPGGGRQRMESWWQDKRQRARLRLDCVTATQRSQRRRRLGSSVGFLSTTLFLRVNWPGPYFPN